jgi:hypothetical protein
MVHEPSTRMVRCIPGTVLAERHGQAMLPPTVQTRPETSNFRTAFLAVQYYLNHFPKGLGAARKKLGVDKAEKSFSRLQELWNARN